MCPVITNNVSITGSDLHQNIAKHVITSPPILHPGNFHHVGGCHCPTACHRHIQLKLSHLLLLGVSLELGSAQIWLQYQASHKSSSLFLPLYHGHNSRYLWRAVCIPGHIATGQCFFHYTVVFKEFCLLVLYILFAGMELDSV